MTRNDCMTFEPSKLPFDLEFEITLDGNFYDNKEKQLLDLCDPVSDSHDNKILPGTKKKNNILSLKLKRVDPGIILIVGGDCLNQPVVWDDFYIPSDIPVTIKCSFLDTKIMGGNLNIDITYSNKTYQIPIILDKKPVITKKEKKQMTLYSNQEPEELFKFKYIK